MSKTNRELNQAFEARETERVRPKQVKYNYKPLEEVIRMWVQSNERLTP
jgi:hypothetical protein